MVGITLFKFENNTKTVTFTDETLPLSRSLFTDGDLVTNEPKIIQPRESTSEDVVFLRSFQLTECCEGAASCPMHPFVCSFIGNDHSPTARMVLDSLGASDFQSEHIASLDAKKLPFQGYHPGTFNDEIHNDFSEQIMFCKRYEDAFFADNRTGPIGPEDLEHGKLMHYVRNNTIWYVLLHSWIRTELGMPKQPWVVMFAVGLSPKYPTLVGCVTHQLCHNFCD